MEFLYDKEYLKITVEIIETDIDDLSRWSTYNNDALIYEIVAMKEKMQAIKEKMTQIAEKAEGEKHE